MSGIHQLVLASVLSVVDQVSYQHAQRLGMVDFFMPFPNAMLVLLPCLLIINIKRFMHR